MGVMRVESKTIEIRLSREAAILIRRYSQKLGMTESELASALLHEHLDTMLAEAFSRAVQEVATMPDIQES
jgi:hypothetical protein